MDFDNNLNETIQDADPVKEAIIADLDGNGFDEAYIFTISTGSGSYGKAVAFASNKDKSLSMINFPGIQEGDNHFKGYMGHYSFAIINQKLIRAFPVYLEGDTHRSPGGGKREITYGLYPGEAMWQLKIEKAEEIK